MVENALSKTARPAVLSSAMPSNEHCGARLEKILFPRLHLQRALDEDEVAKPLEKSRIEINIRGSLTTKDHPQNGHVYVIVSIHFDAKAVTHDSKETMVSVELTCAGYFKCAAGHSLEEVTAYVAANSDEVSMLWTPQIYSTAVMEFERLVSLAGLPAINMSLSPPFLATEGEEVNQTPTAKPKRPRKKVKPGPA